MATTGISPSNLGTINRILAEIGRSVDAGSEAGSRISNGEAEKLVGHLNRLPAGEQAEAHRALQQLLVNDFFSVTPEARQRFAKALGLDSQALEPRAPAELIGLQSAKTAFQAGVQALAKTPQMDRRSMKKLVEGAETFLDRPAQGYLAAVLRNASRDGTLKMDTEARRTFTKWMGGLESENLVADWSTGFDRPGAGRVDYLSQLMSSNLCFEDLVAAFMMHMAGQIQEETKEKMEELRRAEAGQTRKESTPPSKMNELFRRRGLDQPAASEASPAASTAPALDASATGPSTNSAAYMAKTKQNLEAIVQSVHAHTAATDDTPNFIDANEAKQIAQKFARLEGPVAPLIARAMVNSLRSTPGVYLESETFRPMVDWMKSQLGNDIDLSPLPRRNPGDASDPVARQLRSSDKLEDKLASFVVDTLLCSDTALGDKMKDLKRLTSDMMQDPVCASALQQVSPSVGGAPKRAQAESAAQAPGAAAAELAPSSAPHAEAAPPEKSRQMLFEELKNLQQELSAVMQALSNMLNSMHQNIMNSVRGIR